MKNNIKILSLILVILLVSFTLAGCQKVDEHQELINKSVEELDYLEFSISSMLNAINNIPMQNYEISLKEVNLDTNENGQQESSSSGSSSANSSDSQQEGGSSSGSGGSSSGQNQSEKITVTEMIPSNILNRSKETNWDTIKQDIEDLYEPWNTIILDLYKLNVNNEQILNFTTQLDNATKAITEENKKNALVSLSNMYAYIPMFLEYFSTDTALKNIKYTKSYIFSAYSIVEDDNWEEVKSKVLEAEKTLTAVINNLEFAKNNEYNINKTYVVFKELQNSLNREDVELFYIKYKNFMEEINIL